MFCPGDAQGRGIKELLSSRQFVDQNKILRTHLPNYYHYCRTLTFTGIATPKSMRVGSKSGNSKASLKVRDHKSYAHFEGRKAPPQAKTLNISTQNTALFLKKTSTSLLLSTPLLERTKQEHTKNNTAV